MENVYKCKFKDRCPGVSAAGVLTKTPGNTVEGCFKFPEKEHIYFIETRGTARDKCGERENIVNGTVPSKQNKRYDSHSELWHILKENDTTPHQHLMKELRETAYSSHWRKPLGRRPYTTKEWVDPEILTHGINSKPRMSAGDLINPPKSHLQVFQESEIGKRWYKISHDDYDPGEQIQRNYCFTNYHPCLTFGEKTPNFPDGRKVRSLLTWINSDPVTTVSVRQADFVDGYKYHLGKSHDFTKDCYPARNSTEDSRFGICLNSWGHHPLLGGSSQCSPKQEQLLYLKNINRLRYYLKKRLPSFSFQDLLTDFKYLDTQEGNATFSVWSGGLQFLLEFGSGSRAARLREHGCGSKTCGFSDCPSQEDDKRVEVARKKEAKCCGQLPVEVLSNECRKHNICINKPLVKLMAILGILREENCVDYCKFVDLINWQSDFPVLPKANDTQNECPNYGTIYTLSMTGEPYDTSDILPAGISSSQLDSVYPRPRNEVRSDIDNLEYETNAMTLLNPSMFTRYGLSHRDFFRPRDAEQIQNIFARIGVHLPATTFQELWKEGCRLDNTGGVCVETFRNLLNTLATQNFINS